MQLQSWKGRALNLGSGGSPESWCGVMGGQNGRLDEETPGKGGDGGNNLGVFVPSSKLIDTEVNTITKTEAG